ncbi:MAG: basic amino acid ABC transporter substrate-binding protein [Anaerolineaceae bacterium]|nr:basic amino acid ABC transporter substrate-binding protein [Anaerolineaceae bacterium]
MKKYLGLFTIIVLSAIVLSACGPKTAAVSVATDATFPPFETVDEETKELTGFDVELMNAIAEKAGLEIEWVNQPFDSMLAGVSECQYDMSIAAITITDKRKETMLFSDPYVDAGQIVVVAKGETEIMSKDDLAGKTVAAQLGTTGEMEAQAIADVIYKPYDTYDLALLDLMNGQVDAVIADKPTADSFVGQYPDDLKTVGEAFTEEKYGIAFCKDKADLQAQVNEALKALQDDGKVNELIEKWLVTAE